MILLDSDHLTALGFAEHSQFATLSARLGAVRDEPVAVTVVSVEEATRGWLAEINRRRDVRAQVAAYSRLAGLFEFFTRWQIVPFDDRAAETFTRLRKQKVRIGTMDLKIAAIAITQDALLLSAKLSDFQRVPGLRVENWMTG